MIDMNVMIVVPHPDDEVLGFGGVIQKHVKSGDGVLVYFLTEIKTNRLETQFKQFPEVAEMLGYKGKVYNTLLNEANFVLNVKRLEEEIESFKPDILYSVFGGDNHQDHEYIFKVIRIATRVWSNFLIKKLYVGEILSSTDQSPKLPQYAFIPTYYVPLTKEEVKKKIACMKHYQSEIQKWPHPRSEKGLINLAEKRGSDCGNEFAESFMVLRDIKNS